MIEITSSIKYKAIVITINIMPSLKSKITNAAKNKAKARVRATLTPARLKMAKATIHALKAAVPKKQQKTMTKGAKKLVAGLKKVIR